MYLLPGIGVVGNFRHTKTYSPKMNLNVGYIVPFSGKSLVKNGLCFEAKVGMALDLVSSYIKRNKKRKSKATNK